MLPSPPPHGFSPPFHTEKRVQPEVLLDRDLGRWGKYLKEFTKARGSRSGKGFLGGLKQTRISHLFIHRWASYLIIHIQVFTSMVRTSRGDHKYSHKNILARKKPPAVTHHSFPHSAPGSPRSRLGVAASTVLTEQSQHQVGAQLRAQGVQTQLHQQSSHPQKVGVTRGRSVKTVT